jgi:hypothetical protein
MPFLWKTQYTFFLLIEDGILLNIMFISREALWCCRLP